MINHIFFEFSNNLLFYIDFALEIDFICMIIKFYAKMTMLIVKYIHKCHINRISVAITLIIATIAASTITMSLVSIEIQTEAKPLIHRTVSCHCIRTRTVLQITMYPFMFDKLKFPTLAYPLTPLSFTPSLLHTRIT